MAADDLDQSAGCAVWLDENPHIGRQEREEAGDVGIWQDVYAGFVEVCTGIIIEFAFRDEKSLPLVGQ